LLSLARPPKIGRRDRDRSCCESIRDAYVCPVSASRSRSASFFDVCQHVSSSVFHPHRCPCSSCARTECLHTVRSTVPLSFNEHVRSATLSHATFVCLDLEACRKISAVRSLSACMSLSLESAACPMLCVLPCDQLIHLSLYMYLFSSLDPALSLSLSLYLSLPVCLFRRTCQQRAFILEDTLQLLHFIVLFMQRPPPAPPLRASLRS
jgi:hypothetical protein